MARGSAAKSASPSRKRSSRVPASNSRNLEAPGRVDRRRRDSNECSDLDVVDEHKPSNAKRPRTRAGSSDRNEYQEFRIGNIVFLKMTNFLTFSDTILRPGPRLNLILGPNGTGKSSIVNAVCVAFGGKLGLLGRASELGAYVRHGAETADVEAWLYDPRVRGNVRRVRRRFDNDGKSEYFLDGAKVRREDIERFNREYDIQLDNLSQFMPQEKIAEFVNLKPEDLLHNTVRALGGTEKLNEYHSLIEFDAHFLADANTLAKKQGKLDELTEKNRSIEAEVSAFHELQRLKNSIRAMKRYLPWTFHHEAQQSFIAAKEKYKKMEAAVISKREEFGLLRGPLIAMEERRKTLWDSHEDAKMVVNEKDWVLRNGARSVDDFCGATQKLLDDIQGMSNAVRRRDQEIERANQRLAEETARLNSLSRTTTDEQDRLTVEGACRQRGGLQGERRQLDNRRSEIQERKRAVSREIHRLNARLQGLSDARSLRIAELEKSSQNRGISSCVAWVNANRHKFRSNIYGPVVAEVDCKNDYYARVIKTAIAPWAWAAFVVECTEDQDTLRREIPAAVGGFKPNIVTTPLNEHGNYDVSAVFLPDRDVDDRLKAVGIVATLPEIYSAPEAVKSALNAQFQFHRMHIGCDQAENHLDELQRERGVGVWYTPSNRCQVCRSRYDSSAVSTSVDELTKDPGIFAGRIDEVERERNSILEGIRLEERKLQDSEEEFRATETDRNDVLVEEERLGRLIQEARNRIAERSKVSQGVSNLRRRIELIKCGKPAQDADLRRKDLQVDLARRQADFVSQAHALHQKLKDGMLALAALDKITCGLSGSERELRLEKQKQDENSSELQMMESKLSEMKANVSDERRNVRRCQADAERSLPHDEYRQNEDYFKQFPFDPRELQGQIDSVSAQCRHMTSGGYAIVEEYERNKNLIKEMEQSIETLRRKQELDRQTFTARKSAFHSWLDNCIQRMRVRFSELFMKLGCRGDIEVVNSSSDRMADLAIQILVSYRDDVDLRPISATGNSGGEKMACTMLYCFSLQGQEKSPAFVMIDELNQGLDPDNERYIMKVMLEDAERGSAPQSFVVTPKLLLNLPVYANTATHIIMNGAVALPVLEPHRL